MCPSHLRNVRDRLNFCCPNRLRLQSDSLCLESSLILFFIMDVSQKVLAFYSCVAFFFLLYFHDPTYLSAACCNILRIKQLLLRQQKHSFLSSEYVRGVLPNTTFLLIWVTYIYIIFFSCCQYLGRKKKHAHTFTFRPKVFNLGPVPDSSAKMELKGTTGGFPVNSQYFFSIQKHLELSGKWGADAPEAHWGAVGQWRVR